MIKILMFLGDIKTIKILVCRTITRLTERPTFFFTIQFHALTITFTFTRDAHFENFLYSIHKSVPSKYGLVVLMIKYKF